jgi:hypothetical protein
MNTKHVKIINRIVSSHKSITEISRHDLKMFSYLSRDAKMSDGWNLHSSDHFLICSNNTCTILQMLSFHDVMSCLLATVAWSLHIGWLAKCIFSKAFYKFEKFAREAFDHLQQTLLNDRSWKDLLSNLLYFNFNSLRTEGILRKIPKMKHLPPNCLNQNANGTIWKLVSGASQWVPMLRGFEKILENFYHIFTLWWPK